MFGIARDSQIISLDWDRKHLRVGVFQVKGQSVRMKRLLSAALPQDLDLHNPDAMGGYIRHVLRHEGIRVQSAVVDVPRDQCVLKTISLPPAPVGDMAGMVQLQIAKELPFPLTDAVVDFAVPDDIVGRDSVEVLVAAVKAEVLRFYRNVCSAAQLKLERVGLRPYANTAAIHHMLGPDALGRVLYADVGPSLTEIGILKDGNLVFSRAGSVKLESEVDEAEVFDWDSKTASLQLDAPDSSDQQIVDRLAFQINLTVEAYRQTDPGAQFDQVVIAGCSGFEERLTRELNSRYGAQARVYDPSNVVPAKRSGEEPLSAYSAVIGLGLSHRVDSSAQFDFVHPKKPVDAAARRRQKLPLAAAAVMLIVFGTYGAREYGLKPVQDEITEIEQKIADLKDLKKEYSVGVRRAKTAKLWQKEQMVWPDELVRLMQELPSDGKVAYLKDLFLDAGEGRMTFKMASAERDTLTDVEERLNGLFDGEKPRYEARTGGINSSASDPLYRNESQMTVYSVRIRELIESKKKKGKKGKGK